jgi:hypothetical protein
MVAHFDGGFRGAFDGVAAVPFWATLAFGALLTGRVFGARFRASAPSRVARIVRPP